MRPVAPRWLLRSSTNRPTLPLATPRSCSTRASNVRHASPNPERNIARLLAPPHSLPTQADGEPTDKLRRVNGFVRSVRKQKRVAFVALGDGSTLDPLQVVMTPQQAEGLSTGIGLSVIGDWVPSPPGKLQAYELHAQEVTVFGDHDAASYPLQKKYQSPEFLRTMPHLRARTPFNALLLRLRSHLIAQITLFFAGNDFIQTHPPIITSSDCEGAGEAFTVMPAAADVSFDITTSSQLPKKTDHFFQDPKYLTVSSQLHLEALAQSVGKVWALSPTFRAERSDTPRHLSEFYMLEAEVAFTENLEELLDLVENLIRSLASSVKDSRLGRELVTARSVESNQDPEHEAIDGGKLESRWNALTGERWLRMTFSEAVEFLQEAQSSGKASFEFEPSSRNGLQAEHEKYLTSPEGKNGPVFVTHYPRDIKAFYMSPSESLIGDAEPTVACFDLLLPDICEVVGGSLREHRHSNLLQAMKRHGFRNSSTVEETGDVSTSITSEDTPDQGNTLQWYLDLRRYGSVPHGGFGLGFDRLLCYLSGVSNIRDTVTFPRWYRRSDC